MESIIVNGVTYVPQNPDSNYVVIRSRDAGVFAGYLESHENGTVVLKNSRRIYYWDGAATLSQLSQEGVSNVKNCKFPIEIPRHTIVGVCEIIPSTEKAKASIASVPIWKA
jgi:hypothetical protein